MKYISFLFNKKLDIKDFNIDIFQESVVVILDPPPHFQYSVTFPEYVA